LRFPTPAGSVALGSLRSPLLHLPRRGWEGAVGELITESFLHRRLEYLNDLFNKWIWRRNSIGFDWYHTYK